MPVSDRDRLRATGLRVTQPRLAAVRERSHPKVDAIAHLARARLGRLSTHPVHDVLHALTDVGLTRRFEPGGGPARHGIRTGDDHHHLVCRASRRRGASAAPPDPRPGGLPPAG